MFAWIAGSIENLYQWMKIAFINSGMAIFGSGENFKQTRFLVYFELIFTACKREVRNRLKMEYAEIHFHSDRFS